jgi:dienelactone hydrolase
MKKETIEYSDGTTTFIGDLYRDETQGGRRPGVVVFPEAFGLNDHARERAQRLARLGYVALAADPHGGGKLYPDLASVTPSMQALFANRAEWRGRARAALDALQARSEVDAAKTAAIGFCFGGATCLELARAGAPLAAIVTFHAGLLPELPDDAGKVKAKVLVCHGADDPLVKKETMEAVMSELKRDKVDWQVIYYGNAQHSFSNPEAEQRKLPGLQYNAVVEARAWAAMRSLFDEAFK